MEKNKMLLNPLQNNKDSLLKVEQLNNLMLLAKDDYLDLYFVDESGFSLTPSISYHWQQKNENVKIVPRHHKRINVFGIMSQDNDLLSVIIWGKLLLIFVKGLDIKIFYLPKYSPHLNSIEILWRKIKYEWLRAKDYLTFETLEKVLEGIFSEFGNTYSIK